MGCQAVQEVENAHATKKATVEANWWHFLK
jgi:hypothetical protein